MVLQFKSVTKYIGARKILSDISLIINKGQRAGLVGRNGCGKSTLFKLIVKEDKPHRGEIIIPEDVKTGYLPQGFCELHNEPGKTVKDFLFEPVEPYMTRLAELEKLMGQNLTGKEMEDILKDYGKISGEFEKRE